MRILGRTAFNLAGIAFSALAAVQVAYASIGTTVAVIQQATAQRQAIVRTLEVGGDVFVGDLLKSGPIGLAQLVFQDDTRLVVGPNSALRIDTYLLRNQDTVKDLSISALRGSFRFLSGHSPSKSYEITTANATIGVRGTAFDISSRPDGTGILTYKGTVVVCNRLKKCGNVDRGELFDVASNGDVREIKDPAAKRAYIKQHFPFALDQSLLMALFQVDNSILRGRGNQPRAGSPG